MSVLPSYQQNKQTITFAFPTPIQLTVISPAIIRVFIDRGESGQSYAIEGDRLSQLISKLKTLAIITRFKLLH